MTGPIEERPKFPNNSNWGYIVLTYKDGSTSGDVDRLAISISDWSDFFHALDASRFRKILWFEWVDPRRGTKPVHGVNLSLIRSYDIFFPEDEIETGEQVTDMQVSGIQKAWDRFESSLERALNFMRGQDIWSEEEADLLERGANILSFALWGRPDPEDDKEEMC